jgi:hypothetical protein
MRKSFQRGCLKALCCLAPIAGCASGQWLNYATPGIPRLPDGKPNLSAPAPHTLNGMPDLSGIWAAAERHHQLAMEIPGGAPFTGWSRTIREARLKNEGRDIPTSKCLPSGIPPDMLRPPAPFKIIQGSGMTAILLEEFNNWRQIFTDGRSLPVNRSLRGSGTRLEGGNVEPLW